MSKLVIILPVLVLISLFTGSALAADVSMEQLIPFAQTSDDGGALGEKAKVQAMREALNNETPQLFISDSTAQVLTYWLTAGNILTAIREDEI